MCENTESADNWWDTPEGIASIRQDSLRHLIWGLKEADVHGPMVNSKLGSAYSGLLFGIDALREDLLAWAKSQLE
jgi:hypothetical protein